MVFWNVSKVVILYLKRFQTVVVRRLLGYFARLPGQC